MRSFLRQVARKAVEMLILSGAQRSDVLKLVVGEGMTLALIGIVLGLATASVLTRFLGSLLFGPTPTDFTAFAAASLLLAAVAFAACFIPASNAAKIDPVMALRVD